MRIGYLMQAGVPDVRQRPLSGPANHVHHVIEELRDLGHQVRLLFQIDGRVWKSDDLEVYEPVPVRYLDKGIANLFERFVRRIQYELKLPYLAMFESIRFAQACRQELANCDLLYERMGWVGYGGGLAARWLGIPLVLEANGDHISVMEKHGTAPQGLQRRLSSVLMKESIRLATHLVASGEGWRKRFIEGWHTPPAKITVIHNGSEIVKLLERGQLSSFQVDEQRPTCMKLVYVGALEPWHGIMILLESIAKAISKGASVKLALIGAGTEQASVEAEIANLGIVEYVELAGQLGAEQLVDYLVRAEIGVSPYCDWPEYAGMKILDYKSAGLATIASGENGQPSILDHGRTGWIVPPCNAEALCEAIVQLAANPELRARIGREARIEAEACHSWRHTVEGIVELLESLVEK